MIGPTMTWRRMQARADYLWTQGNHAGAESLYAAIQHDAAAVAAAHHRERHRKANAASPWAEEWRMK